jgi:hypothetical protein
MVAVVHVVERTNLSSLLSIMSITMEQNTDVNYNPVA